MPLHHDQNNCVYTTQTRNRAIQISRCMIVSIIIGFGCRMCGWLLTEPYHSRFYIHVYFVDSVSVCLCCAGLLLELPRLLSILVFLPTSPVSSFFCLLSMRCNAPLGNRRFTFFAVLLPPSMEPEANFSDGVCSRRAVQDVPLPKQLLNWCRGWDAFGP